MKDCLVLRKVREPGVGLNHPNMAAIEDERLYEIVAEFEDLKAATKGAKLEAGETYMVAHVLRPSVSVETVPEKTRVNWGESTIKRERKPAEESAKGKGKGKG